MGRTVTTLGEEVPDTSHVSPKLGSQAPQRNVEKAMTMLRIAFFSAQVRGEIQFFRKWGGRAKESFRKLKEVIRGRGPGSTQRQRPDGGKLPTQGAGLSPQP